MKQVCLLILVALPLLVLPACKDIPGCEPEEVLAAAERFSPDCVAPPPEERCG